MNRTLSITIGDNGQAEIKAEGLIFPEIVRAALTIIEASAKQVLNRAKEDFRPTLAEDMFEQINVGASTLLNRVFPDIALRPDITAEAIAEAEARIIAEDPVKTKETQRAYLESGAFVKDLAERRAVEKTLTPANSNKAKLRNVIDNVSKKRVGIK